MSGKRKGGAFILAGLGLGGIFALAMGGKKTVAKTVPPSTFDLREAIRKISEHFKVPENLVRAIFQIESNMKIGAENHSPRAEVKGGAWGIGQMTLDTAKDLTARFPKDAEKYWPEWDKTGKGLLDPAINIPMSVFFIARNYRRYEKSADPWMYAGLAHHQGAGNVDKFIKAGNGKIDPSKLPPNGKTYWDRLNKLKGAPVA